MNFMSPDTVYAQASNSRQGLPAWTYNNAELTDLEINNIFLKTWLWAGHVSEISEVGDYQCMELAHERAVIIRGEDDVVRAFHNVCNHRASRVVPDDKGHCRNALVCPFHGWSYHLDGRLKNIPRAETFPAMDKSALGLKPIECEVWHGMIFIRFFGSGPSVAETLKDAEEEISLYKIEHMQPLVEPWTTEFNCDWKSIVDIDSEGYHVPMGHKDLYDLLGRSYYDQVLNDEVSRSYGNIDAGKHKSQLNQNYVNTLPQESYLPATHQREWIYWSAFPGFVITLFPDQIEIYHSYPISFQKSAMAGRSYALTDERPEMKSAREYNRQINIIVGQEDVQLLKWSAEGMRSSAYNGAIMSDLEVGTAAFHNQLRSTVPVALLDVPPPAGTLGQVNQQMVKEN